MNTDTIRTLLTQNHEVFVEKTHHFRIKIVPFFAAVTIKKDHRERGDLIFTSFAGIKLLLAFLCLSFSAITDHSSFTLGPLQWLFASALILSVVLEHIAMQGIKTRLLMAEAQLNAQKLQ